MNKPTLCFHLNLTRRKKKNLISMNPLPSNSGSAITKAFVTLTFLVVYCKTKKELIFYDLWPVVVKKHFIPFELTEHLVPLKIAFSED